MKKETSTHVFLIEDEQNDIEIMSGVLSGMGHNVVVAKSGTEARLKLPNQNFDFIVLNMDIRGMNSLEFTNLVRGAEKRKNIKERTPILVHGSYPEKFQEDFSQFDNVQFLPKPFSALDFKEKMTSFKKKSGINPENIKKVEKGEFLIKEGVGKSNEMYWVLSGTFLITKVNKDNENVTLGEVKSGELVGEMSFLDNLPRSASVMANEESEVLVIPHKKFVDVLDGQPRWFRSLMSTLSSRLRDANDRIAQKTQGAEIKEVEGVEKKE